MKRRRYDIERGLISQLLSTKDMVFIQDQQIKPKFFTGDHYHVYRFILDYFGEHSEVPTVRVIESKYPNYAFETVEGIVGTEEPLSHWCAEIRNKAKHNKMADLIDEMANDLTAFKTADAFDTLKNGLYYIENEVEVSSDIDITKDTQKRKELYLKKKETQGMLGISYGIPKLDYYTKGLENGTLTTLIARAGVGKTWVQVLVGAYAMLQNYRVLHCLTEMSEDIMRDRYDAMLYGMTTGEFNYAKFKSGTLSSEEEESYFRFLEEDLPLLEPLILHTATDVSSVLSKAEAVKADIIMIDGAYLMEDQRKARDDWLRVTHITRDLKKGAKRLKKPIFINHQADKSTSKQGPELENIMYAQSLGQDCLPKGTLILTDTGYKQIQKLEGEVFYIFDGRCRKKAYCCQTGIKQVVEINYRGSVLKCSPTHKLYVYDNEVGAFVWKRAKDVQAENDFLLEQDFAVSEGHSHVIGYSPKVKSTNRLVVSIDIPTKADADLGMLIGMFIGNGSIKPLDKGQVTMACGHDFDSAYLCMKLVKEKFGLDGRVRMIKSSTSGKEEIIVTWYSIRFARWLDFFINDEAHEKTVKLDYCEMNYEFRLGLLSGLIQTDGSCSTRLDFATTRESVAIGFDMLCKTFGVCTRTYMSHSKYNGKEYGYLYSIRFLAIDLHKIPLKLVGKKMDKFRLLVNPNRNSSGFSKPSTFITNLCKEVYKTLEVNSSIYKSVGLGIKSGKLGQKFLSQIWDSPFKFMQVDDVLMTSEHVPMWDVQVFDDDKTVIANGVVTHNSDVILALYRDETMRQDKEMGIKVLKQREGMLGKLVMKWDMTRMDFSEIYSVDEDGGAETNIEDTRENIVPRRSMKK